MTFTRVRVALLAVTSLTLCAVACITGQAGGGGWAALFFALAAITADAAAHTPDADRECEEKSR